MSKLWENFFGQEPFEFRFDDLGAMVRLEDRSSTRKLGDTFRPQDRGLMIGLKTHSRAWNITLTSEGKLAAEPEFVHSKLLGALQRPLYNSQGDEQAIVSALTDELCLMVSDPVEKFAENYRFPPFFKANGKEEMAYHARVWQGGQGGCSLTLLTGDKPRRPGASLVVLGGMRGCLLLKAMPVK